jgi:hypothetical protein
MRTIHHGDEFDGFRRVVYTDPASGEILYVRYEEDELLGENMQSRYKLPAWLSNFLF